MSFSICVGCFNLINYLELESHICVNTLNNPIKGFIVQNDHTRIKHVFFNQRYLL